MTTIFAALCGVILAESGNVVTGVIASATYDGLKKAIDLSSLGKKVKRFFNSDEEANRYIEDLCTKPSVNPTKPFRDIEDHYEELTGNSYDDELFFTIKDWVQEHSQQIITASQMTFTNTKGFNIGQQHAGQDIINVQGDFYKSKKD
ncbi:hypothetical protein B9T12_04880 [Wohlfahrtiimonas chitiniclastica]|uniref:hypothetical protein n=1 Tax=Wohlfahrtiimonas TaxID=582472 RepID=UPI000B9826F0|nr:MULTISPECIES: hypothetical protein [Wohlfahrtiimonas]OYQ75476.1 hypothetical protein B9T20_01895 [Wohlfahrtiimonas sp. G9077]OYQ79112.1 hypothetical protein B9T12_04880 [Wohlfahrtiimonas chitiniclastica]